MKKVLIAGYKASELGIFSLKHPGIGIIKKAVRQRLLALMDEGLEWAVVSGQWGVELWAAEAALELKKERGGLRLAVITPFLEQEANWNDPKKDMYARVIGQADYVASVTKLKYEGPWQFKERDRFLLRNTDGLILLYDEEKEGSPRFLKELALRQAAVRDYPIYGITEQDLQNIAEDELQRDVFYDEGVWTDTSDNL